MVKRMEAHGQIFDRESELHGDRATGDDPNVIGGFGWVKGVRCLFVWGRGRALSEAGARKVERLARLAEHLGAPILLLGAAPDWITISDRDDVRARTSVLEALLAVRAPIVAVWSETEPLASGDALLFDAFIAASEPEGGHPAFTRWDPAGSVDSLREIVASALRADRSGGEDVASARRERVLRAAKGA